MQTALTVFTMVIHELYNQFQNELSLNYSKSLYFVSNPDLLSLLDFREYFLSGGTVGLFSVLIQCGYNMFDEIKMFDTYDFAVFTILLILMFTIALRCFLNNFEFSIWKTKRMLGILPTKYMAGQLQEIKSLIKQIS